MRAFAKTLLAGGLGMFGMLCAAEAGLPYGYTSSSYGIAVGGCYGPAESDRCDPGYGTSYRPTSYDRSAYGYSDHGRSVPFRPTGGDRFRALPYSPGRHTPYGGWDDDCGYGSTGRLPSRTSSHLDRYDGSPLFEPWRPASASHRLDRRNW